MIEKKDWLQAKKNLEDVAVNTEVNLRLQKSSLKEIELALSEFPDEKKDDPMPESLKEVVGAVK